QLTANYRACKVKVKQLGANTSALDGNDICQNTEVCMTPDSTLFILSGHFPHRVIFLDEQKIRSKITTESPAIKCREHSDKKETGKELVRHENGTKVNKNKPSKRSLNESSDTPERKKTKTDMCKTNRYETLTDTKQKISKSENGDDEEQHLKMVDEKLKQVKKSSQEEKKSYPNESIRKSKSLAETASYVARENVWTTHEHLYVFTSKGVKSRSKIASFDLDGTLIDTKSGKVFPVNNDDWKILYPEIFNEIKRLHQEKYKIVIFTNQLGVSKGKTSIDDLKNKVENVVTKLQVPIQVFIATYDGEFRKPCDGMWEKMKRTYNDGCVVNTSESFYVGDAAGRPKGWAPKKKKDFSNSDRLFALNIGLAFKTPEEYFLHQKATPYEMPNFDPRKLSSKDPLLIPPSQLTNVVKEVIVLVGLPSCGKSFFSREILKPKGYVVVNRDTLGSWQKCVKMVNEALVHSSVVVDNTNLSRDERGRYIECSRKAKVLCRCFLFTTSVEHCRHNEKFRQMTDKDHAKINEMIFNKAKSKYERPDLSEGFKEIIEVNFVPKFSSSSLESKYTKFLLEK
ncbi:hypothetical protein Btru_075567, partial [Bulinus truncatus]